MAKFVIAGRSDCPFYARIELLADKLVSNLPDFKITKIVKQPNEWEEFVNWLKNKHGWNIQESPIVWRELVNQGGKGTLIGGADDFQEQVIAYYDEYSHMSTEEMINIASDNTRYQNAICLEKDIKLKERKSPSKVIIIGPSSPATTHIFPAFLNGDVFGENEFIDIYLYDEFQDEKLINIQSSLELLNYPMLNEVHIVYDLSSSLVDAKQLIILDILPRKHYSENLLNDELESRENWLTRRYAFFMNFGKQIKNHCSSLVKILVASDPGCYLSSLDDAMPITFDVSVLHRATYPKIPPSQITGLVKPMELRLKATIAEKLKVYTSDIRNLVLWGNIGSKMFVDASRCRVSGRKELDIGIVSDELFTLPLFEVTPSHEWIRNQLMDEAFKDKCSKLYQYSGINQGYSISEYLCQCWHGKSHIKDEITSLVLISNGSYGVPKGIAFSFPVTYKPTNCWSIVEDIDLTEESSASLKECLQSVLEDWSVVDPILLQQYLGREKELAKQLELESEIVA